MVEGQRRGREAGNGQGGVDLLMTSMMDYLMKQNLVFVLCSLILAAGFVAGMSMGRYHVETPSPTVIIKVDRMTGQVWRYIGGERYSLD
jgi:hypothetical protein